ncbi:uncharacterized protein LOC125946196 [Dermacentor silvarum]|uniref:uncharacterized protein LOC125946196 n=1 Tax=Dermacentor silvarum TaxID=543639 RepID=UPI00210174F2|nr:uncharacterized protein LOC125946196 [Dermacentor silvarum]
MLVAPLLSVLLALAARAHGHPDAGRGVVPGAIIVDVRHGLLLPQGRSREELEPVIRDSLRILDLYLHETAGSKKPFRRVKRSADDKHLLSPKPIGDRLGRPKRSATARNVGLPGWAKTRPKRSPHYALNAFAINPKPANESGGYYTLFARVSEAALQDLMARQPPVGKPQPARHRDHPNRYSGELFEYVANGTASRPRLPPPQQAPLVLPVRNKDETKQDRPEAAREGVKCIYRKNSVLCYQSP